MRQAIATPIHSAMTPQEIAARLRAVQQTYRFLLLLCARVERAEDGEYPASLKARVPAIEAFDGFVADQILNWLTEIHLIREMFERQYQEELAFITAYRSRGI